MMHLWTSMEVRWQLSKSLLPSTSARQNKQIQKRQIYPLSKEMGFSFSTAESGKQFDL